MKITLLFFLLKNLLDFFKSNGVKQLYYSDPLLDKSDILNINDITVLNLREVALKELIVTDIKMNFAFINLYLNFRINKNLVYSIGCMPVAIEVWSLTEKYRHEKTPQRLV
jgi:predicted ATP-grasp superfamily ATP-dependent carboligase